jgi:hypothetical protein
VNSTQQGNLTSQTFSPSVYFIRHRFTKASPSLLVQTLDLKVVSHLKRRQTFHEVSSKEKEEEEEEKKRKSSEMTYFNYLRY